MADKVIIMVTLCLYINPESITKHKTRKISWNTIGFLNVQQHSKQKYQPNNKLTNLSQFFGALKELQASQFKPFPLKPWNNFSYLEKKKPIYPNFERKKKSESESKSKSKFQKFYYKQFSFWLLKMAAHKPIHSKQFKTQNV